jgi:hypothetical protein
VRARSRLNVGIHDGLKEAGIEVALPQRDLHLRSVSHAAAEELLDTVGARRSRPCLQRRRLLDGSCRDNMRFTNGHVARRSAPSTSRKAQRQRSELQARGPLPHELDDLRV